MIGVWAFVAAPVILCLVGVAIVVAYRRQFQDWLYPGTGLREWRLVAGLLPVRDRWSLYVANSFGRAAPDRLAALAVQRGEALVAVTKRIRSKGSPASRIYLGIGIVGLVNVVSSLIDLLTGDGGGLTWSGLVCGLLATAIGFGNRQLFAWEARQLQRSVDRNRPAAGNSAVLDRRP